VTKNKTPVLGAEGPLEDWRAWRCLLACAPDVGPVAHQKILRFCTGEGLELGDLLASARLPRRLKGLLGARAACSVRDLIRNRQDLARRLRVLLNSGVGVLLDDDGDYPQILTTTLGEKAPRVLFYRGRLELLSERMVGIVGARRAAIPAIAATEDLAAMLAGEGHCIISGNADGVDRAAHAAALRAGGRTVFVAPVGIASFRHHREMRTLVGAENSLVISHAPPFSGWRTRWAFMRNSTVAALCQILVAVQSGEKSGTVFTATEALRMGRPVFAGSFSPVVKGNAGNAVLIRKGALALPILNGEPSVSPDHLKLMARPAARRKTQRSLLDSEPAE